MTPGDDRMSDVDKILWVIEANPQLRSTITAVLFFDRPPDRRALNTRVEQATRRVGRLRQRVVSNPYSLAPPRWETDPAFNLSYHLRWSHLGGSGTRSDVLALAEPIAMQSFDKARPLWELTVVEGLEHGAAAVVAKVHHTITDGVGGVQLLLELFDLEREPRAVADMPPTPRARVMSQRERFHDALLHELQRRHAFALHATGGLVDLARDPMDGARRTVDTTLSALRMAHPTTRPMSPLLEAKSLNVRFHQFDRRLDDFRDAARAAEATVNDIFVTGVCRGLATWHQDHGVPLHALRMGMPISARRPGHDTANGANQFLPARLEVPLGAFDVQTHVHDVGRRIRATRDEPALALIEPLAGVLSRLPRFVLTNLFSGVLRGQDFLASNVPGAPVPIYFAGAEMTAMVAFGPLSGTALNITLFSHCRNVHIGVSCDPEAIPDSEALIACLERGIDEVLGLGRTSPPVAPAKKPKAKNSKPRR